VDDLCCIIPTYAILEITLTKQPVIYNVDINFLGTGMKIIVFKAVKTLLVNLHNVLTVLRVRTLCSAFVFRT